MNRWPPPLRILLPGTMLAFGFLALGLVLVRAVDVANRLIDSQAIAEVRLLGALTSQQVEAHLRQGLRASAQEATYALNVHRDLDVAAVVDADDRVVFATRFAFEGRPFRETALVTDTTAIMAAQAGRRPQALLGARGVTATAVYPMTIPGDRPRNARTGTFVVRVSLSRLRAAALRDVLVSSAGISILLLAGALLFWWLAIERVLQRRVVRVMEGVERIGRGDYSAQTGLAGGDEFARISRALDRMAVEISRSTEALRMRERRFRELIEFGSDLVLTLDRDLCIVYAGPSVERVLGWRPEELSGRQLVDVVHAPDAVAVQEAMMRRLASPGFTEPLPVRFLSRGGAVGGTFEIIAHNPDSAQAAEWLIVNGRDVTERLRLEGHLRQTQKMDAIGRLAGGIAHDFNNLLTVILGRVEAIAESLPAHQPDLQEIHEAAQRAAALTAQVLAFSRKQVLEPQVVDLNALVTDHVSMLRRLLGSGVKLRMHHAADLARVRVDPVQIGQVIVNLVLNARDALPEGGEIVIETANVPTPATVPGADGASGRRVALLVRDRGIGMSAATLAKIFEPFFTTKGPGKGTGMGLAMALGIAEQSGGTIDVESAPGEGSTFRLLLPGVDDGEITAVDPPRRVSPAARRSNPSMVIAEAPADPASGTGETILVAEDEENVRTMVVRYLERVGYRVLTARNATEAIAAAARHAGTLDLLITDVVMPGMSGPQLAKQIAAARPGIRVIIMSGYADPRVLAAARETPGTVFLPKPFRAKELVDCVRETLATDPPGPTSPAPGS